MIEQYIGEIILGSSGIIIASIITGVRSVFARVKKLEERIIKLEGALELNTALDKERAGKS